MLSANDKLLTFVEAVAEDEAVPPWLSDLAAELLQDIKQADHHAPPEADLHLLPT